MKTFQITCPDKDQTYRKSIGGIWYCTYVLGSLKSKSNKRRESEIIWSQLKYGAIPGQFLAIEIYSYLFPKGIKIVPFNGTVVYNEYQAKQTTLGLMLKFNNYI